MLLIASIMDIGFPVLSKLIFKSENWTGEHEKQFENVCAEICVAKLTICNGLSCVFASKEDKSPVVSITLFSLNSKHLCTATHNPNYMIQSSRTLRKLL